MKTTSLTSLILVFAALLSVVFSCPASARSDDPEKKFVTCPDDKEVCYGDPPVLLNEASPTGGSYSGTGVYYNEKLSAYFFDPSSVKPGSFVITYEAPKPHIGSCNFTITVHHLPSVSCPKDMVVEVNEDSFTLTGATPSGGYYTGPGVVKYLFYPSTAGVGTHTIQYIYTDSKTGCSSSCSFNIEVYEDLQPPVAPTGMNAVALSATSVSLSWSDHADNEEGFMIERQTIGKSAWTPIATVGANVTSYTDHGLSPKVTYAYRVRAYNDAGHSGYSNTAEVTTPPVCPADFAVCQDTPPFALTGGMPTGGEYIGEGIYYDAGAGAFMLDPSGLTPSYYEMVYEVYEPEPSASCIFLVTVHPTPAVSCPANFSVEIETAVFALTGASPAGGTYAGPGILPGYNEFDAAMAGVGSHTIEYIYTDGGTGCTNLCSFVIEVYEDPKPPLPPSNLVATGVSASQASLTWTDHSGNEDGFEIERRTGHAGAWSTIATVGVNVTSYQDGGLSPGTVYGYRVRAYNDIGPSGYSNISEATTHPLCPDSFSLCQDEDPIQIPPAVPAGGIFTGPGLSHNAQTDVYTFDPSELQPGTYELTYMMYDPAGSCVFVATVHDLPEVVCPDDMFVEVGVAPFNLEGATPVPGGYTGPGVDDEIFDPEAAGVGLHEVTYTYTDLETGCTNACSFQIEVYRDIELICPDNLFVCADAKDLLLFGASPEGGSYMGSGIYFDAGLTAYVFSPEAAGTGVHEISYELKFPEGTYSCTFTITVHELPEVICPNDMLVEIGTASLTLEGGIPAGGTFSGTGVSGDVFDPGVAGMGIHSIVYTYTDPETGCSDTCSFHIEVYRDIEVLCPNDMQVCANDEDITLAGGLPEGGSYSGKGVWYDETAKAYVFMVADSGPGVFEISYGLQFPEGTYSCTFTITVNELPEVDCPDEIRIDISTPSFGLTEARPQGGMYEGPGILPGYNEFDPAEAGIGSHEILYTYTDPDTGCSNHCWFVIEVAEDVDVSCPEDMFTCLDWDEVVLEGADPPGGTYSGEGVSYDESRKGYIFAPSKPGTGSYEITYTYTTEHGSHACVFTVVVDPCTGIANPDVRNQLSLYPNPARTALNMVWHPTMGQVKMIQVIDTRGLVVDVFTHSGPSNTTTIPVHHYPAGLYIIRLLTINELVVRTFVVIEP